MNMIIRGVFDFLPQARTTPARARTRARDERVKLMEQHNSNNFVQSKEERNNVNR